MIASEPKFDPYSGTWAIIKARSEKRLEEYTRRLETAIDMEITTNLRGRIAELRNILGIADHETEHQETTGHSPDYSV